MRCCLCNTWVVFFLDRGFSKASTACAVSQQLRSDSRCILPSLLFAGESPGDDFRDLGPQAANEPWQSLRARAELRGSPDIPHKHNQAPWVGEGREGLGESRLESGRCLMVNERRPRRAQLAGHARLNPSARSLPRRITPWLTSVGLSSAADARVSQEGFH